MAILDLVTWPDPLLKEVSQEVTKVTDETRKFMDSMLETMYDSNGIGLAAVQVGRLDRILVMDIKYPSERYADTKDSKEEPNPLFLINPKIIKESKEKNTYDEGCLSFPGIHANVTRPKTVSIEYLDYHGKKQILEADDLLATCVQHEMDHLNGITFVDHLSALKRKMVLKKLKKLMDN